MIIKGITFDFWNTLYGPGESGETGITRRRLTLLQEALAACGAPADLQEIELAHISGFEAYVEAWRSGRQYGAREQVLHVFAALDARPCDGVMERTATLLENTGAEADLCLLPGAAETLPGLAAAGVKLGLISDTGLTPGRILQGFLERDGLLGFFSKLTFSDETGFPKPDPRMFHTTLRAMGVEPSEALHVGDTPRSDIAGALGVGMQAVRFAAANDMPEPPEPLAVIRDHRELVPLLRRQ
jgi:HAD superfamily hydrolase (TIGR01549 family)